jgi:hypothetical protein
MKKVLFICGSRNQTTQLHKVSQELARLLPDARFFFTPFYGNGVLSLAQRVGLLESSIMGSQAIRRCLDYLLDHNLNVDYQGWLDVYDLVVTCTDLVIPKNLRGKKVVLVQEGMTDPEDLSFHLVKRFRFLQSYLPNTATTGLSDKYDHFCVASNGYRDLFVRKGVKAEKVAVTGIPNFDDCERYQENNFPHHGFVLVCTSDMRETFKYENRRELISRAVKLAKGRPLIFKLHPNENVERATKEINFYASNALIFSSGSAEEMIANCETLITRYSSVVFVGLALGKEVYSDFNLDELKRLLPLQNHAAARNIAQVCSAVLNDEPKQHQWNFSRPD